MLSVSMVQADETKEIAELRMKAETGDVIAQVYLGWMYENGNFVVKDRSEAMKCYRKAAEQGYANAQYRLGRMYDGAAGLTDDSEAVKWYRMAADQGYAIAQVNLGRMYHVGAGLKRDRSEAMKWYLKAADQEFGLASLYISEMYRNGDGVTEDKSKAMKWSLKMDGDTRADGTRVTPSLMIRIGCYGVMKDSPEAVKWIRKAAEQGYASAQYDFGYMYLNGDGVMKDRFEALKWIRKAAEQGYANAQWKLAMTYYSARENSEAVKWYRKAAEQGHGNAQFSLGWFYANGEGVTKDLVEAYAWYYMVGADGLERIALFEKEMTREQIAEATKLGREYFEKYRKKR